MHSHEKIRQTSVAIAQKHCSNKSQATEYIIDTSASQRASYNEGRKTHFISRTAWYQKTIHLQALRRGVYRSSFVSNASFKLTNPYPFFLLLKFAIRCCPYGGISRRIAPCCQDSVELSASLHARIVVRLLHPYSTNFVSLRKSELQTTRGRLYMRSSDVVRLVKQKKYLHHDGIISIINAQLSLGTWLV